MTSTTLSHCAGQDTARRELRAFLQALAGPALTGDLFELRESHGQLMRRRFIPVEYPDRAVSAILRIGRERDVYLGAAVRAHRHGGRAAIACLSSLWVDADTPEAIQGLRAFEPAPAILVATGRGQHAYWLLDRPVDVDTGEDANQRLAHQLAADVNCFDAARILRPPHTHNFKQPPPQPVRLLRLEPSERRPLAAIVGGLPAPRRGPAAQRRGERDTGGDPLLALEPAFYVSALLGVQAEPNRKVSCPFHVDEDPSLHVYPTAAEGWSCFSCQRGGTVYDLAAQLWDMGTRKQAFLKLRARLHEQLFGRAA
jgi:hypothetical protein